MERIESEKVWADMTDEFALRKAEEAKIEVEIEVKRLRSIAGKIYREANRDKISEVQKLYYAKNKEKLREYGKAYNRKRRILRTPEEKEKRRLSDLEYREKNKEKKKLYMKTYFQKRKLLKKDSV